LKKNWKGGENREGFENRRRIRPDYRFESPDRRRASGGDAMDVSKILAELREERQQIEEAILSLERLAQGRGRRRGRPPAWMSELTTRRRGRPPGSKNKVSAGNAAAASKGAVA
jgi:hypothetical protein